MASNEERREVAERLREREHGWRKMGTHISVIPDMPATQFEDIAALLGFNGWILDADIFARLADLIDPTCEMEDAGDVPASVKDNLSTFFCSECGAPVYNDMSPSYCPYCGARVVRDDD